MECVCNAPKCQTGYGSKAKAKSHPSRILSLAGSLSMTGSSSLAESLELAHREQCSNLRFKRDFVSIPPFGKDGVLSKSILHLLFGSTQNFKNWYIDFQKKKSFICPKFRGERIGTPRFDHLVKLYHLEHGKPLKIAVKLSGKMLHPSSIEKTNVSLADACFHETTIEGLDVKSRISHSEFAETVPFLRLMRRAWNIMNCKSPNLGQKRRNSYMKPVSPNIFGDWKLEFLQDFADWLEEWKSSQKLGFTEDTFLATIQTARSLVSVSRYLLQHFNFKYILLGKFQSDDLEKRFRYYRQICGGSFSLSLRQVIEAEKKISIKNLLKHSKLSLTEVKDALQDIGLEDQKEINLCIKTLSQLLGKFQLTDLADLSDKNILFFVAGYISRSVSKVIKCEGCKGLLVKSMNPPDIVFEDDKDLNEEEENAKIHFLQQIHRGGLFCPTDSLYLVCLYVWEFYVKLQKNSEARSILINTKFPIKVFIESAKIWMDLVEEIIKITNQKCSSGHDFNSHLNSIVSRLYNCMMKNFVSEISQLRLDENKKKEAAQKKKNEKNKKKDGQENDKKRNISSEISDRKIKKLKSSIN